MKKLLLILLFIPFIYCSSDSGSEATAPPPIVTTPPVVVNYTLTVSAGDGGAVSSTGGTYTSGESVSITATANSEYVFSGWSNGSTENPLSVTMNSNQTISASFVKVTYTLSTSTEGEGSITETLVSSGRFTDYNSGSVVRLTAVPSNGWIFIGWTGDYVGEDNPIDIDVSESISISASFEISIAVTFALGRFLARLIAMQPLPVPMSKIFFPSKSSFNINLTNSSVSVLGIKTELLTLNSISIKLVLPKTYCMGS